MNNKAGLDIAAWRHVIQTDGVPDLMGVAARKLRARIVLNVHSANDHLRSQLVPQNRVFPIRDVINALRRYIGYTEKTASKHKEVTFDYALLDGINDTYQDMQDLIELIEGLPAHVNLIPVNLWPEKGFHASPIDKVMGYLGEFKRLGISCSIRTPPRFPRL